DGRVASLRLRGAPTSLAGMFAMLTLPCKIGASFGFRVAVLPGSGSYWLLLAFRGSPPGRRLLPVIVETSQVARFRPRDLRPFAPRPNPSFFANVDRASEYAGAVSG